MGMSKSEISVAVLRVVADAPAPIKGDAIRAHESLRDYDSQQISNAIFRLAYGENIVRDESGRCSVTAKGRASLASNGTGPAVPTRRQTAPASARKKPNIATYTACTSNGAVESMLRKLAAESQNALDTYLQSVGDRAIYEPLKRARDDAEAALVAYTADPSTRAPAARQIGEG